MDPLFSAIDHIGIAAPSIAEGIALYCGPFGLDVERLATMMDDGTEAALIRCGGQHIEVLAPTRPDSPVGKFLAERGPGIHHVAYRVAEIHAALAHCRAAGLQVVDEVPRTGAMGHLVAFLHPRSTGRVLIELVQE